MVAARAFAKVLGDNKSLEDLDLSGSDIGEHSGCRIANAVRANKSLRQLNLSRCNIGPKACEALAEVLESNTTLTSLVLEGNNLTVADAGGGDGGGGGGGGIGGRPDYAGVKALGAALRGNSTLTALNLWRCELGHEGGVAIANGMAQNNDLVLLDVGSSNVGQLQLASLADHLERNKNTMEARQHRRRVELEEERRLDAVSRAYNIWWTTERGQ